MSSRRATGLAFGGLVLLALAVTACGSVSPHKAPDYATLTGVTVPFESYVLDNGLTVITHVVHSNPFVAVHVRYRVGSADESPGKEGLAHLVEHLMFDGSRHVPPGRFWDELGGAAAADANAQTSMDATTYHEVLPPTRVETALRLESDRMAFPLEPVNDTGFARERHVVENELRERRANGPYAAALPQLCAALFPEGHPYHHIPAGAEASLESATLADARAFVHSWYAPNNASLVLVGDFDAATAKANVEKYFGPIVPRPLPERASRTQKATSGERRIKVEHGGGKAYVAIAWELPPEFAEGTTAMAVAGGALGGFLRDAAVDEDKVAEEVSVALDLHRIASVFLVYASVRAGHTHQEVLASLDRALDTARGPHFSWAPRSWRNIITSASTQLVYQLEEFSTRAALLSQYEDLAGSPGFIGVDLRTRRDVLSEEARDAYYQYLPFDHGAVGFFVPRDGAPREGTVVSK